MNEYELTSNHVIGLKSESWVREKLLEAHARIVQLDETGHILRVKLREAQASGRPERRVEPDRRNWNRRLNATPSSEGRGRRTDADRRQS